MLLAPEVDAAAVEVALPSAATAGACSSARTDAPPSCAHSQSSEPDAVWKALTLD